MDDQADAPMDGEHSTAGGPTFTVSGRDRLDTLAAGLDAILQRVVTRAAGFESSPDSRAAVIRGEGPDLAAVFADLAADLLEQLEETGGEAFAVRLDGLLRKDQGGFVAWGYVDLPAMPRAAIALPRLAGTPVIDEADGGLISIRGRLLVE